MSFIKQAIADAKESEVAPEGTYDLRVHSAEEHVKQGADKATSVKCVILFETGDGNYMPINHYIPLVTGDEEDDDKSSAEQKVNNKLVMQKRFLELFNVSYQDDGFDPDDIAGATAEGVGVIQDIQEKNNLTGEVYATPFVSNKIRLPKSKSEEKTDKKSQGKKVAGKTVTKKR